MFKLLGIVALILGLAHSFLNGVNMPWNQCGNDYGLGMFDSSAFQQRFSKYADDGSNFVRLFVHFDGCKQYQHWDEDGSFKPLGDDFLTDFVSMLEIAKSNNLQILPSLWSFECVDCDACRAMLQDSEKTYSYVKNGIGPLLSYVKLQGYTDQIYAWEIINEPEWTIEGGPVSHTVSLSEMQEFMKTVVRGIRGEGALATIGSASLKWTCNQGNGCVGNWWKSSGINFYSVHYYDWMVSGNSNYDPYTFGPDYWGLDKDVLIGEAPGESEVKVYNQHICSQQMLYDMADQKGYLGHAAWADNDSSFSYQAIADGLHCMKDGWPQDCQPTSQCESQIE